ncbi:transmembrane protein 184A-like isoform X2 [Mangifera indica]|uniref:transmembrane protein 184A-like isoform X2 n=1 Tax=Mangifera indica TaxID=29780 RepID=UPI001CFB6359|nr:transmembrane protein 184A-like isoform X2 [Mangifera indica]
MGGVVPIYYHIIAFLCTVGATSLAVFHIYRHLLNYTEPTYQRYIVRIIFMVPVYALMSFLALVLPYSAIYFNSIREVYEAWVIYNFLSLCLAWVGGPGAVVLSLSGRVLQPSFCLMTCCFPPIPLDGRFIRRCKQGCLQFVILKPILVVVTLILYAKGKYKDGNFSPDQGVLVFLAAKSALIKNADDAADFQNFIVCVEMLIAAVGHFFAFPYKEYAGANIGGTCGLTGSLAHAVKLNDFYHDTVHQFAPTYHEYVLYNHSEGDEGTKKYRSRTFVPTGQEMEALRRNKLDDIQLSSVSSSAASTTENDYAESDIAKSSLLVDTSNLLSVPYDLSVIDIDMSSYPAEVPAANETETR